MPQLSRASAVPFLHVLLLLRPATLARPEVALVVVDLATPNCLAECVALSLAPLPTVFPASVCFSPKCCAGSRRRATHGRERRFGPPLTVALLPSVVDMFKASGGNVETSLNLFGTSTTCTLNALTLIRPSCAVVGPGKTRQL
jgi:hypothetical protein